MGMSMALRARMLAVLLDLAPYASLHVADPSAEGLAEVAGGNYSRRRIALRERGGEVGNQANVDFTGLPGATITHVGLWSAADAGEFLWGGPLQEPRAISAGDTFRIPAGALSVRLE